MYQASANFNTAILGNSRKFRAKIKAGATEVTEGIRSIKQYSRSVSGDYISIGGAVSSYVEVEMWKPGLTLENTEVEISIGVVLGENTEWVPLGLYTPQKPAEDDGVVKFIAYDRIQSKMAGTYFSELTYPADGKAILAEISTKTGVPIDTSSLPAGVMIDEIISQKESDVNDSGESVVNVTYAKPFDGYTYRDALGYIAQFYSKFATVNRAGTVVFRWYSQVNYTIGTNRYYDDLETAETVFTAGAIACQAGEVTLVSGTGSATMQIENPAMTQVRLDAIYQSINGLQFIPAGLSFLGDMCLDVGDIVTVNDKQGNIIRIPIMSMCQDFDGGLLTKIQSFGSVDQDSYKGPTEKKFDHLSTDLFKVKELVGNKANFELAYNVSLTVKDHTAQINTQSGKIESVADRTSTLEIGAGEIRQTVAEVRTGLASAEGRVSTAESQILQQANQIALKVEKNGIISAINQSAEEVKIKASKITLAGATIADSFTATNLHITGNSSFVGDVTANGSISIVGTDVVGNIAINTVDVQTTTLHWDEAKTHMTSVSSEMVTSAFALSANPGTLVVPEAIYGNYASFDSQVWAYRLDADTIMANDGNIWNLYAGTIYEGNTALSAKYAVKAHDHQKITLYGTNTIPNNSTQYDNVANWGAKHNSIHFYTTSCLTSQPSQYGFILNLTTGSPEVHQIWAEQPGGSLHHRGGNSGGWSGTWKTLLDSSNYSSYVVPKSGGAFTGDVTVAGTLKSTGYVYGGDKIFMWTDNEGGNLEILSPNGTHWQIDAFDNNFRLYNSSSYAPFCIQKAGHVIANGQITSISSNGFRVVNGNYGFFIRNDGGVSHFLLTNSGDQYGNWNTLRPLSINNSNGRVTMENGLIVNNIQMNGNSRSWHSSVATVDGPAISVTCQASGALVPLARIRTAKGAWGIGAYDNNDSFYIYYLNNSYLANGTNATIANYYFKSDGTLVVKALTQTSDETKKDIISGITKQYESLFMDLCPILHRWRDGDTGIHMGLGAQSVYQTALKYGLDDITLAAIHRGTGTEDPWGIGYTELIPLTIHMTQKAILSINTIRDDITTLRAATDQIGGEVMGLASRQQSIEDRLNYVTQLLQGAYQEIADQRATIQQLQAQIQARA